MELWEVVSNHGNSKSMDGIDFQKNLSRDHFFGRRIKLNLCHNMLSPG
jgi:hypothetical protein